MQGTSRPVEHLDQAVVIPGLPEMGRLAGAMLQEWEVAMHNAAVASAAQTQPAVGQAPGQAQAQPQANKNAAESEAQQEASDLHQVQDLVEDIRERPSTTA